MEFAISLSLGAAAVATGMVAGVFFVFSCAVMPALRRTSDPVFIEVMQRINAAILNGWFLLAFLGAPAATALAAALALVGAERGIAVPAAAALALYLATITITRLFNLRMNEELDRSGPAGGTDPSAARRRFEGPWTGWNLVRTVLSTASAACLAWALALL